MAELSDYGIDIDTLREMYERWQTGTTKSSLERDYLDAPQSHGKLFSTLVREHLGIETEKRSSQSDRIAELEDEVERLRRRLRERGVEPTRQNERSEYQFVEIEDLDIDDELDDEDGT